jgi:hypothetical protein
MRRPYLALRIGWLMFGVAGSLQQATGARGLKQQTF